MRALYLSCLLLGATAAFGQTPEQREKITKDYDHEYNRQLIERLKTRSEEKRAYALKQAKKYGWKETIIDEKTGIVQMLKEVDSDTIPVYYTTYSASQITAARTDYLHLGGGLGLDLTGNHIVAGVWDGNIALTTHEQYNGRVTAADASLFEPFDHPSYVTGIIIGDGSPDADARGMAHEGEVVSYEWFNDLDEVATEADHGLLLSNHSYGDSATIIDWKWGAYIEESASWDEIMYNNPGFLMVQAAGNYGDDIINTYPMTGAGTHFDKLSSGRTSKNPLVVANGEDPVVDTDGDLVSMSLFSDSSWGPTDDMRIKPDITALGTDVRSAWGTNNSAYFTATGTSSSAPNVTGTLMLLQQYSDILNATFMQAATLKGLVLHTADDIDTPGPDPKSGWGMLNAKKAAVTMSENGVYSLISENVIESNEFIFMDVVSDGINPLMISISWTDPAGTHLTETTGPSNLNSLTSRIVNHLDLYAYQDTNNYFPYYLHLDTANDTVETLTGGNNTDPFERVDIENASGKYTLRISSGTLTGGEQAYTLIITGIMVCGGDEALVNITVPVAADEFDGQNALWDINVTNKVLADGTARYRAGNSVQINSGFFAENDSDAYLYIGDCSVLEQSFGGSAPRRPMPQPDADTTTGIKPFYLYPNPGHTEVTLSMISETLSHVTILSIDGKPVLDRNAEGKTYRMDISNLQKGIYIVTVETANGKKYNEKLVID